MNKINTHLIRPTLRGLVLALAATVLSSFVAQAHPYASGITNTGGTISFILNESADNVQVVFPENNTTNNLGARAAGPWSFTLGPGTNSYLIYVTKAGTGVPTQISPTPVAGGATNLAFNGPRGVAVNRNPKGHNFGRIYVANAAGGFDRRAVGRGLYVLNADYSDCLGYGTNEHPAKASFPSGGTQWWGSSTTYGVYRLCVGPDDTVYVGDSSGSPNATTIGDPVWMIDSDLTTPFEVFPYIGASAAGPYAGGVQSAPFVTGSLGAGNLLLTCLEWGFVDGGLGTYNSLYQYNIGSGPIDSTHNWTTAPTILVANTQPGLGGFNGVVCDVAIGTNGYIYVSYPRANAGGIAAGNNDLWVYNSSGTQLWASSDPATGGVTNGVTTTATNDCFLAKGIALSSIAASSDGQLLAFGNANAANFCLVRLTNGIPDNSTIATYSGPPNVLNRQLALDAADNLYTVEGSSDSLRCYSLGFTTTCVTSNDASAANGSFWMILPPSSVSVTATTPNASQGSPTPVPGVFTLTRQGQLTSPLYVHFSLGGTASNSTYTVTGAGPNITNVTFAVGQGTTNITITPVNDSVPRLTTSVILSLSSGTNYSATAPLQATVNIQNTAEPQLVLSAGASTCYKRYTNDYASVTITRLGRTNETFTVNTFTCTGTAVSNTDYAVLSPVVLNPGDITVTARILRPLNPPELTWAGNKTVLLTLGNNGSTYTSAPGANTATLTILDDKYPAAPVLWSDPLTSSLGGPNNNDDGSGQWNITAVGRDNGATPPDYTVDWGYDLVNDPTGYGMIPLPPNGLANALRVTYNKVHGGVSGAVNLYPTNHTFSGDYAVRFQMYIGEGGKAGGVGASTTTEGPMFGINHDGLETNWWTGSAFTGGPWTSDGVWYWMDADPGGSGSGDYIAFTGISNNIPNSGWAFARPALFWTSFTNAFKDPEVFTTVGVTTNAVSGIPANASPAVVSTNNANWADVEMKQVKNVVTLSINKTVIFTYVNTNSLFQQGSIMLGYEDPYDSGGNVDGAVYYSNLQVVQLATLNIISISLSGPNVVIQFTGPDGSFALQSCGVVNGTYTDVSPAATFTQDSVTDVFQTVYPQNGAAQYYRIRYQP